MKKLFIVRSVVFVMFNPDDAVDFLEECIFVWV